MLAEFKNRSQLEAWLGTRPPEAAVLLAARAALRVSPVVQTAKHAGFTDILVLPAFRATAFSWAAAKYPVHQTKFGAAAAAAYAAAAAVSATVSVALATADAAAIRADYNASIRDAYAAVAADSAAAATHARAADAYAAVAAARAAAAAARAAAARAAGPYAGARTYAAAYAAAYAEDAIYAAAYADARTYAVYTASAYAADSARGAPYAGAAAAPSLWSALSTDATRLEKGAAASAIASSPLWPQGQPDQLQSLWQEMKAALLAAKQDWQVWTIWYEDRLDGRVRDETRELGYARIEEALWDQGPAVVNAEIERRIAMSAHEDRLRGRTTDLEPEQRMGGSKRRYRSEQGQATEDAEAKRVIGRTVN
jgi:hypothetical protein